MKISREAMGGITMSVGSLAAFTAVAAMLQQAGLDFAEGFTACVSFSIVAALASLYTGAPVMLTPSLTITGYLVFIAAIAHGLGWQAVLGISFWASVLGLLVWYVGGQWVKRGIAPVFSWAVKLSLATFLIYLGLKMGRIIITSTWQVTMLGDVSDPLMYWSTAGAVLTIAFLAAGWRCALLAGMLITGGATFAEGFWVIPAAPFFLPAGLADSAGQLLLLADSPQENMFFCVTIVSLGVMLSAVHWSTATALAGQKGINRQVKLLFALDAAGALWGVPPLVISPTTALPGEPRRSGVLMAVVILVVALFCEPILAAIADFPAMVVPVLVGSGFLLLLDTLRYCPLAADDVIRRAELLAVSLMVLLLLLTGNFATALGTSVIGYALFMSMAGKARQVSGFMWLIGSIFVLYYIYGSMF